MKKIKNKILIIIILIIMSININRTYASGMPVVDIAAGIKAVTAGIKQGLQLKAEVQSKISLIKQVKDTVLANQASTLAGTAIQQIGQNVLKSITSKQNDSTNILTNGAKVVTNLDQFLKKNSINAIKSTISDLSTSGNIYTNTGIKNIIENIRSKDSNTIVLQLPKIAQDEICNSDKLKNIIKNGEPSGWYKPKSAVANIDIDKLCDADLSKDDTDSQKAQASFISLAKSNYAGSKTKIALSDSANTPAGIKNQMQNIVEKQSENAIKNATDLYSANGGIIGNMICLDTKGNVKHFDSTDPNNNYCSKFVTDKNQNPATIAANQNAAALAPYLGVLAQAQNANNAKTNKYTGILGDILSIGTGVSGVISDIKNIYTDLSTTIDSLTGLDENSFSLANEAINSQQEYENNTGNNSEISSAIDRYDSLREINIDKLNAYVYTYVLMTKASLPRSSLDNSYISNIIDINKINISIKILSKINTKIKTNIINLIKEMSKDNYNRQQLEKIKTQTNSSIISDILVQNILKTAPTDLILEKNEKKWDYIPEYQETNTSDENSTEFLIPLEDEINNPTTKYNLSNIRIRSYKLGKKISPTTITGYTPNIPLEADYLLDINDSASYSEATFCTKIGHGICN